MSMVKLIKYILSGAPLMFSALGGQGLTRIRKTRVQRFVRNKHSSLFDKTITRRGKFYSIDTRLSFRNVMSGVKKSSTNSHSYKTFFVVTDTPVL
jgi:hypothetical protein